MLTLVSSEKCWVLALNSSLQSVLWMVGCFVVLSKLWMGLGAKLFQRRSVRTD